MIRAINYTEEDCGETIKMTRRRYAWVFQLEDRTHEIALYYSFLSGHIKIEHNGSTVFDENRFLESAFLFSYTIDEHSIGVLQHGDGFELRIDNQVFSHLMNQERVRQEFETEKEPGEEKRWNDKRREETKPKEKGNNDFWASEGVSGRKSPTAAEERKDKRKEAADLKMKFKGREEEEDDKRPSKPAWDRDRDEKKAPSDFKDFGNFADFSSFSKPDEKKKAEPASKGKGGFDLGDLLSDTTEKLKKTSQANASGKQTTGSSANVDLLDMGGAAPQKPQNVQPAANPFAAAPVQSAGGRSPFDDFGFSAPQAAPQQQPTTFGGFNAPAQPVNFKPTGSAALNWDAGFNSQQQQQQHFQQQQANPFGQFGAAAGMQQQQQNNFGGGFGGQQNTGFGMQGGYGVQGQVGYPAAGGHVQSRATPFDGF